MSFSIPAFDKTAVVSFVEHAATAAVIGAIVAYEAGARDYKVLAGAGVAAGLNFVKHFVQEGFASPAPVSVPPSAPIVDPRAGQPVVAESNPPTA